MSSICCIVGAGPSPAFIKDGAFVIAADGGLDKVKSLGVVPDLILGDFDSLEIRPEGKNVMTFPVEKDDTDTMLAIKEAIGRGYTTLYISGGVGGRLDHTVANLQSLLYAAEKGACAYLVGEKETAAVLTDGSVSFRDTCRGKISVFSVDAMAEGVTIDGLQYEVTDVSLTNRFPLGVSNAFIRKPASVSVRKGTLLLIWEGRPEDMIREGT